MAETLQKTQQKIRQKTSSCELQGLLSCQMLSCLPTFVAPCWDRHIPKSWLVKEFLPPFLILRQEAMKQNAYYRALEADLRKADLASATMGQELEKAFADMKELNTVTALQDVSKRIPAWVDSFREATSKKLLASFEETSHRLWPVVRHRGSLPEIQDLATHLRTLPAALGKQCPQSLQQLEREVSQEVQQMKRKQRQDTLLVVLEPFVLGRDVAGQEAITCEDHENLCKTMATEQWEGLVIDDEVLQKIQHGIFGIAWSCVRYAQQWLSGSEEAKVVLRTANAMVKAKDLIQEMAGLAIRHAFSQRAHVLVGLVERLCSQKPEELAAGSLVDQTHLMTLLSRCQTELNTTPPASLDGNDKALFDAMEADIAVVMATAAEYQETVKHNAWKIRLETFNGKLEALKGLVGNPSNPQVWSTRLPQDAEWPALAEEAKKTILKGDYISKVRAALRAAEEDESGDMG